MSNDLNLQLPVFEEFSRSSLDLLHNAMRIVDYPAEHVFVQEGEHGDTFYVVLEGKVRVSRCLQESVGHSTESQYITTLEAGDLFGLVALVDRGPRSATCIAASPCRVASLNVKDFERLSAKSAEFAQQFEYVIAKQLARDIRVYNQALHQAIRGNSNINTTIMFASSEYRGPERRVNDRRRVERRRQLNSIPA